MLFIVIFLLVAILSLVRVQHSFETLSTILARLHSLIWPRKTVTSPIDESLLAMNSISQQMLPRKSQVQTGSQLLSRCHLESVYPAQTWQRQAYDSFVATLVAKSSVFPCIYATKGFRGNEQRFLFLDSEDLSSAPNVSAVASALTEYLPQSPQLGPNTSLVVICKASEHVGSVQDYHDLFWSFLKSLRSLDPVPWPAEFPNDIDSDDWCFCFHGYPTFSVVQTPAHEQRQSRHAPNLRVIIQPKWIFDVLFSTPQKRAGALKTVRELLKDYDSVPLSPDLKNYGEVGSRECRQYFLLDENSPALCPYRSLVA